MLIENLDPVIFILGPLEIRWYGLLMALSFIIGGYYLVKNGKKEGLSEGILFNMILAAVIGGIIGARAIYVITNLSHFMAHPEQIYRVDQGGLAFHGGLLGGLLIGWFMAHRYHVNLGRVLDLAVPGIAMGYILIRIANIFNQEILGRPAALLPFELHPTQVYGSLIGLTMLLIHNYLARTRPIRSGELFWSFVLYYSLLRGIIEETFRDNPLYLWGYVSETWGAGFFTLTQLATPFILLLAWFMRKRIREKLR